MLKLEKTDSKMAIIRQVEQNIHNLKVRWSIGIKAVDDAHDRKLLRLEAILACLTSQIMAERTI